MVDNYVIPCPTDSRMKISYVMSLLFAQLSSRFERTRAVRRPKVEHRPLAKIMANIRLMLESETRHGNVARDPESRYESHFSLWLRVAHNPYAKDVET